MHAAARSPSDYAKRKRNPARPRKLISRVLCANLFAEKERQAERKRVHSACFLALLDGRVIRVIRFIERTN